MRATQSRGPSSAAARAPFLCFYVLAWLLPGLLVGLYVLLPYPLELIHGGPVVLEEVVAEAEAAAGVSWTSNLLDLIRLCLAAPVLWLLVIGAAVPTLAALATALLASGRAGIAELLDRLRPWRAGVEWRTGVRVYALLVVVMLLAKLSSFGVRSLLGSWLPVQYEFDPQLLWAGFLPALLTLLLLDQGALLEELGWRGYALPLLQTRMNSPLAASILLGFAWSMWHIPRDIAAGVIATLGPLQYLCLFLPAFTAQTILLTIVITFFFNRLGGSVIAAIMIHGISNDAVGFGGTASMDAVLTPAHQLTNLVSLAILSGAILFFAGRRLGLRSDPGKPGEA